ncbi:signal recognition particle-docking protein FtsY [Bifidobacterium sp. UTBIF-78]|uniref:signal recognition particle-docking protein FtsY n=1 Tax=Bifidobacterium sp. UTBIF-78 TaxID=1465263 RepID=UPI0015E2AEB5|nr:signal recognition particle-docking protein FtsY [Bifidobacterium sp. UTBIF-78]TPF95565.1 cell division protein FtsY [Bifidobacterium sp. UTBIF-78]
MDMNTVLAVIGVIVVAVILIAVSVWWSKSRRRDLDRAVGQTAPDDKRTRDAKAAADARLAAEAEAEEAAKARAEKETKAEAFKSGPSASEPASSKAESAAPAAASTESRAESQSESQAGAETVAGGATPSSKGESQTSDSLIADTEPKPASKSTPEPASEPVTPEAPEAPTAPAQPKSETPESIGSRLTRLKAKLAKSDNPFGKALFNILTKDNLSEADWEDVEDTLLLADVGAEASGQLVDELRTDARVNDRSNPAEVRAALKEKLLDLVGRDTDRRLNAEKPGANKPGVIIMVGVNGTGKTTTAGKLARLFVAEGKQVVMGAADTFRAAAADQLETWGARVNVPVVRSDKDGADPASVAFEASAKAKETNADVLIIDTAGRLQNKANLMDELGKIRRVTEKNLPVDEVLLVLDATTGQNGMIQAKVFAEAIGITGVVLSKLDGSAKGGIVISVQKELGVPVKLVGLGEGPDDLAPFDPEGFVDGILA